jgi:GHH signature containing HNH/Endo VII superfamily nuclease toxin  2
MLVPFNQTGAVRASRHGQGCCPGQTGHHILPGAMFEGQSCYAGKHGSAPTICLEGVNNSHGSHGAAHRSLQRIVAQHRQRLGPEMTYEQARDAGVASITNPKPVAPAAGCNEECLRKQLDAFYGECRGANLRAHDGLSGTDAERSATEDF